MAINIHFFRNYLLERLDYKKLLEFFDELPNFEVFYTANEVEILYSDEDFQFTYRYLITKVSQVNQIYKLDPAYVNINFLLEIPTLVPEFIVKEILTLTQRICKAFDFAVYNDSFDDVKPFNLVDLILLFKNKRREEIELKGLGNKLLFESDKLNAICKYQRSIDNLKEAYNNEVEVEYVEPVIDRKTGEYGICCSWKAGVPTVFPPYFDYIKIVSEEEDDFMVRRRDFFAICEKYLTEIGNFLPDMYYMKKKAAHKCKAAVSKLRKFAIVDQSFTSARLCDLIDDDKYQVRG